MSEKNKNVEVVEEEDIVEVDGTEIEEPKKRFASKLGAGIKKYGPKVAAGAAAIGLGLIGYMLGKGSGGEDSSVENGGDDGAIDCNYSEVGSEE